MDQCKFFVVRKKRYCRMTVKSGYNYCGEHIIFSDVDKKCENDKLDQRVSCPLDNKHTCFASKLQKHLKICNARQNNLPNYVVKHINSGQLINNEKCANETSERILSNVSVKDIKTVLEKILQKYNDEIKYHICENILASALLEKEVSNFEYGSNTKKHLYQTSSLLENLKTVDLIQSNTSFIEFGAGKGHLSYWIAQATENIPNTSIILVDRASHRHKMDNKLKLNDVKYEERIQRVRVDILDLDLSQIETVKNSLNVVGVTKHLCGVATDLALRCLENLNKNCKNVTGLIMAFCCHHRCMWKEYVGKKFFLDNNFTSEEFDIICGVVSWATSGVGMSREKRKELEAQKLTNTENEISKDALRNAELGLKRDEKTEYGKIAKLLLDYGRMKYLESIGFKCQLYYYVKPEITLENVCIVATKLK